jgi:glycerol kinase
LELKFSEEGTVPSYIGALDQGTTSTRFIVFDRAGRIVSTAQREHRQIYPRPGWVEHDPDEIWLRTQEVISEAMHQGSLGAKDLAAIGITNQRETAVLWDRKTGEPVANAIVWQDTRTDDLVREFSAAGGQDRYRAKTGLPLSTYFSALKVRWLLQDIPGLREKADAGEILFGNVDTFLVWKLTGGAAGGIHVTDLSNASRTQLKSRSPRRTACSRRLPTSSVRGPCATRSREVSRSQAHSSSGFATI